MLWDVLLDACWFQPCGFCSWGFPLLSAGAVTSLNRSVKPAQRLLANAFSMEKEHLLKSVKPFSDQVPHLFLSFRFGLAFCPPTLNYFSLCLKCARCFMLSWKKKLNEWMSNEYLSTSPLLAAEESEGQIVFDKYLIVVEKPAFWPLC